MRDYDDKKRSIWATLCHVIVLFKPAPAIIAFKIAKQATALKDGKRILFTNYKASPEGSV